MSRLMNPNRRQRIGGQSLAAYAGGGGSLDAEQDIGTQYKLQNTVWKNQINFF